MRFLTIAVVWAIATAAGLAFAWKTHYGAVVFVLTYGHGVHKGDLVAFGLAYTWAAFVTVLLWPQRRRSARR